MPRITQLENEPKNNGKNTKKVTPATTERAKNTPTPKTTVDRKTVQPKTTVTKPTATQQKPNANVNTSNLAGVDYSQNKAQPQRNFISEPPKSFSDAINGLTNTTSMPQGKTFVPETNLQTAPDLSARLKQNQEVLSSMADESTEKASKVVNDISNAGKSFLAYLDTPDAHQKMINDFKEAKNQEKLAQVQKENEETIKSLTQEDYNNLLDENGGIKDFSQTIKDIENEIASLDNTASIGNNTSLNMSEDMLANMSTHREALEKELAYYKDLDKKAKAVEESYIQDYLAQSGDTEALASYQEQLSHKNDSLLERAGTATEHLLNTTANIIPTTFDQMIGIGTANYANDNIAKLDEMHMNGEIGDAEYVEALDEWKDYIDKYRATNDDNLSQQIRRYTDQLSANTYYGASDIEKFCLQAGESTAQFLLHYAIGYVVSGAVMGSEALAGIGREALEEGAKATAEQLINAGMQNAGGSIATVTMSLASATEKTNQLLMNGVDPQTAIQNGFMTGLVSYMTEKIGMDRFVDMLGTPVSVDTLGTILLKHAKNGVSEGLEEVAEGLVDPIIDSVTLGTPYEVNGEELFMEFLLGGASGLAMSLSGGAIGAVNTVADNINGINSILNENRAVRQYVQGRIGELVINTRLQRNMVADQINTLKYNMNTMTPQQVEVAEECIARGENAINKYDASSTSLGVTFSSDIPVYPSTEESKNAFFETYAYDFNQEKQFEAKLNDTSRMIDDLLGEQFKADLLTEQTQEILDKAGYKIDANVFNSLNREQQNRALVALDFANLLGMKVNIVNNLKAGDSGFVSKNGEITVDGTKRSILYTLTHELTHGTESSKYYPKLKSLAESSFGREGKAWEDVVNQKIEDYAKNGHEISFPEAEQEVVARFVEDKLGDEKFLDNLIKYHASSASRLFQNLKSLGSFSEVAKVRNAFEKAFADNYRQGNDIDGMEYVINNAEPSLQEEVFISDMNESAYKYSSDSWAKEDKDAIANDLANKLAVEKSVAKKWVNDVNSVAKQIADDRQRLDYEPNRFYSSMKSNDDYVVSMDMSTLCAKRIYLQATIDEIQRRLPNTILTAEDYVNIREAMKEKGYIVSCGFCYVESRRKFLDKVAQEFLDKNNYENLTLADLTTIDGIKNLQDNRPDVYEAFLKHNRARGQAKINLVEERTDYRGEIADKKKLTDAMVEKIIRIGGLRLQSFSDFETPHLIDMMQMVIDMARRGLTAQAYTKVPNFADAMGKTGIKINLSLVCKGLDSRGRLIFDDVEGMPHDKAFKLRKKYSKNVGTILVGKDDATILSAMADPRIDYIIPFHNSGWAGAEYEALGIKGYENYEKEQHEKWIDPQKHLNKNGNVSAVNEFYPADYWDYSKSGKENAEIYLQMCREDGRIPKFHRFLDHHVSEKLDENGNTVKEEWWTLKKDGSTDGYWKTLIDFKMYDNEGVGAPQEAVRPIFDNRVNNRILREYTGEHRNVKPAEDVVNEYTAKLGGEEGTRYSSDSDSDYMNAINRGDIAEVRRMLDRKARESGYSTKVFHGTTYDDFDEFDPNDKGFNWFSKNSAYAYEYTHPYDTDIIGNDGRAIFEGYLKDGKYLNIGNINEDIRDKDGNFSEEMKNVSSLVGMKPQELLDSIEKNGEYLDDVYVYDVTQTKTYADLVRNLGYDGVEAKEHNGVTTYGVLDSSAFKRTGWYRGEGLENEELAMDDIVERDGNGNIIPLSERFDSSKKDMRYSAGGEEAVNNLIKSEDPKLQIRGKELMGKLNEARKLDAEGMSQPDIWEKTGWIKKADGKWRFQFYDGAVETIENIENILSKIHRLEVSDFTHYYPFLAVEDVVGKDNVLFTMYPSLRNTQVDFIDRDNNESGYFSRRGNQIVINLHEYLDNGFYNKEYVDPTDIAETFFHELQHAIQAIEGFEAGSNLILASQEEMEKIVKNKYYPTIKKIAEELAKEGMSSQQVQEGLMDVRMASMGDDYDWERLKEKYSDNQIANLMDYNNIQKAISDMKVPEDKAYERYYRNLGEIEAREEAERATIPEEYKEYLDVISPVTDGYLVPDSILDKFGERYSSEVSPEEVENNILSISEDQVPIKTVKLDSKTLDKNKVAQVLRDMPEVKTEEGKWKRLQQIMNHEFLDHLDRIVELSKEYNNPQIEALADYAMMAQARANEAITDKRREFVIGKKKSKAVETGESLNDIIGELNRDQIQTLGDYLYNWRNVDSMSVVERLGKEYNGVKMKNKTVFGKDVSADESRQRIAEIEAENPWVKERAERLWEFSRQNLKLLLDAGIVSKDTYDYYQKATPHYIPIQRNADGGLGVQQLDPNKADLKFKGSSEDILPLDHNLITHTQRVYNTIAQNALHNEIMNTVGNLEEMTPDEIEDVFEVNFNPLSVDDKHSKKMFAYKNGKKYSMPVDDRLYNSLAPLQKRGFEFKTLQNINNFRRNLITGWNPMFAFTNYIKDYQDAWFNTKHPFMYPINRMEAVWQIARKGELYKLYKSAGGGMNSYVNEFGVADIKGDNVLKKAWKGLLSANEFVETIPRLAEFIASIKDGNTLEQAMLDASEVTTNFKRGGDTAKYLNRNGMAFFNASLQGYRRQLRNIQDAKDGGISGMLTYMAKLALTQAIPLYLINHLMWKDDKDYEELSDYVKQNYYIVKKYGDGKFIRIPKGRISAFYQTVMENAVDTLQGKVKLWDGLMSDLTSFVDNVAPNNPWENFIAKPLWDAYKGQTWYGGDLLSSSLKDKPKSEQFDEDTDELSKAIGRLSKKVAEKTGADFLELSPKKVNYVLDQYSGGVGDIVLPALTLSTTQATKVPFANAFLDKFTTDSVLKNQNVTDLYSLRDKITTKANSLYAKDEELLSKNYLYSISSEMGELYGKMHAIQADPSLSTKEKFEQAREIKKQINELAKKGLANYDQIDLTGRYASVGGVAYYKTDDGTWRKLTESQLKNVSGISDEDKSGYFKTFGEISDARDKIKEATPKGQKADYTDATIDAIRNSDMSASGKNALFDSYYDSKGVEHINNMNMSDEQKLDVKIAMKTAEGKKDENGKTIANSKAEATAEAYRELGVLDDILIYIKDNNIKPSELGLSNSVYNSLIGKSSGSKGGGSSKKKSSSKSSKTSSSSKTIKAGSSSKKLNLAGNISKDTKPNLKKYFNAYQSVFGRGSKNVATGGSRTETCPNCGSKIPAGSSRCPVCGKAL